MERCLVVKCISSAVEVCEIHRRQGRRYQPVETGQCGDQSLYFHIPPEMGTSSGETQSELYCKWPGLCARAWICLWKSKVALCKG